MQNKKNCNEGFYRQGIFENRKLFLVRKFKTNSFKQQNKTENADGFSFILCKTSSMTDTISISICSWVPKQKSHTTE